MAYVCLVLSAEDRNKNTYTHSLRSLQLAYNSYTLVHLRTNPNYFAQRLCPLHFVFTPSQRCPEQSLADRYMSQTHQLTHSSNLGHQHHDFATGHSGFTPHHQGDTRGTAEGAGGRNGKHRHQSGSDNAGGEQHVGAGTVDGGTGRHSTGPPYANANTRQTEEDILRRLARANEALEEQNAQISRSSKTHLSYAWLMHITRPC